ncbi:hypothetical protein [Sporosarcina newyorkensis]|uniref:hypothetical protein n=1 Tax=Sporosarcina newyorkensis TaxID=759851 RepID=UPI003D0518ED
MKNVFLAVSLRILLFVALAVMVFDFLRVEQLFIQMDRGLLDGFSVDISNWPGYMLLGILFLFIIANHYIFGVCGNRRIQIYGTSLLLSMMPPMNEPLIIQEKQ